MKTFFIFLISIFLLAFGACIKFSGRTPEPEIRIGVLVPISGKRAFSGRQSLAGILLARDQINKKGPVRGKKVNLMIIDNKSSIKGSRAAMSRFTEQQGIALVICAGSTADALAVKPLAEKAKLPVLLTIATGNIATERNPYMFRCCFNDGFQAKAMAFFACTGGVYNNVGVLLDLNERVTYRRDLGRAFAAAFKNRSGKNVMEVGYCSGTVNFLPQIRKFDQYHAEAIFAPGEIPDAGIMLNQARQYGLNKVFLGSDGWDHPELFKSCGPHPEPCFLTSMFSPESGLPGVKEFVQAMTARTGSAPDADAAQGYDALRIAVEALKLSKSPTDIRSGLYQIKNYPGVTGNISINACGDAEKTIFIKKIIRKANGEFAFQLVKTISPQELKKDINK
ncbi:MAG: ABC transporter substrate-binding protein [Victivallaceae bacterium]|nr:ABC transporter substrate-binding protein [Victivallaceae bacterium]